MMTDSYLEITAGALGEILAWIALDMLGEEFQL
jgi:hypothetical protein